MKLIVGLGNIGTQYAKTRHNIGFMVADELAAAQEARWKPNDKFKADIARLELGDTTILIAKPQTMMNLSGEAIQKVMQSTSISGACAFVPRAPRVAGTRASIRPSSISAAASCGFD